MIGGFSNNSRASVSNKCIQLVPFMMCQKNPTKKQRTPSFKLLNLPDVHALPPGENIPSPNCPALSNETK